MFIAVIYNTAYRDFPGGAVVKNLPATRIYNGEKTASSISDAGKTGQLHVKE